MNTVNHTRLVSFFDHKVIIDELKEFNDSRGFLCELWRTDDKQTKDSQPEMCYYSHTKPFVMRGPHYHTSQTDWFITLNSSMVYMFVYDNKLEYFITNPNKIYRIKVDPTVIHSYRNLSTIDDAKTANFPSSLFMGKNKKEQIDEIRYETEVEKNKTIFILGADGRLGKKLTNTLFKNMGMHKYHVIPIEDIINDKNINDIFNLILKSKTSENDIIVNCIAKTNVQAENDDFTYANYFIPKQLTEFCLQNNLYLLHFSTDYVYQTGEVSAYAKSKQQYENWFDSILSSVELIPNKKALIKKYIKIIRLANLFSLEKSDVHNMINKFYSRCQNTQDKIVIPTELKLMPTNVEEISKFLSNTYLPSIDSFNQYVNLSGKSYTVKQFFDKFFEMSNLQIEDLPLSSMTVVNNPEIFLKNKNYIELDCDQAIIDKVKMIREV